MGCAIKRLMAITVLLFGACSRKNAKPPLFHVTPLYEACSERITTANVGKGQLVRRLVAMTLSLSATCPIGRCYP